MNSLKEKILHKIKAREVTMRPRRYFTLQFAAVMVVAGLTLLLTVFLFNFIFFSMRVSGHAQLIRSGLSGFLLFLRLFPWFLLFADVALVALLEHLLRRFRFAYRQSVLYVFLVLLALGISVGLIIDRQTDLNEHLLRSADEHNLPAPFNDFYEGARRLPPPLLR